MTLPCAIDLKVDSKLTDPQPVDIRLVTAQPTMLRTAGGYVHMVKRPGGDRAIIQFGEGLLPIEDGLSVLGIFPDDAPTHTLEWNEPTGEVITMNVSAESVTSRWTQAQRGFIEPLIITCKERP